MGLIRELCGPALGLEFGQTKKMNMWGGGVFLWDGSRNKHKCFRAIRSVRMMMEIQ